MNAELAVLRIDKTKLKKKEKKRKKIKPFSLILHEPKEDKGPIWHLILFPKAAMKIVSMVNCHIASVQ